MHTYTYILSTAMEQMYLKVDKEVATHTVYTTTYNT